MAKKIGLTGGIGSGKSIVANLFKQFGIATINADLIAHALTRPGTPQFEQIIERFGNQIVDDSGHIDRKKLAKLVFRNANKRKLLESILHPPIIDEMFAQCRQSNALYCVLEIPLLIESGLDKSMDRVVVVTCNRSTRISRLQYYRNMDLDEIKRILAAQLSDSERSAVADDVITNDSTIATLEKQITALHQTYCALFMAQ